MIVTVKRVDGAWEVEEVILPDLPAPADAGSGSGTIRDAIQVDDRIVDLWRRHLATDGPRRPAPDPGAGAMQNVKLQMRAEIDAALRRIEALRWEHFWWMIRSAIDATIWRPIQGSIPIADTRADRP